MPPRPEPGGRLRRTVASPVVQFVVASGVVAVCILLATQWLAGRAATQEAVGEARGSTALLADTFIEPNLSPSLHLGTEHAVKQLQGEVRASRFDDIERIAIWYRGRLRYSTDWGDRPPWAMVHVPERESELEQLAAGQVVAETTSVGGAQALSPDGRPQPSGELLRTFTGVQDRGRNAMLLEVYYSLEEIEQRRAEIYASFRWIAVGALVVLMVVAVPLLWLLTARLTRADRERARLLESAIDASDRERRRIARDLHDGVVQDLAGTAFAISAVARDPAVPGTAGESLHAAGTSLRDSLRGLRSLLAEIHPPDLTAERLGGALEDLTATAETAGVVATVTVTGLDGVSDRTAAVVWRVAQEGVRNVLRHAAATQLSVTVRGHGGRGGQVGRVVLEVADDGRGFEPDAERPETHFGLRGMQGLVADHGGTLQVVSSPGHGTRVLLEVGTR